MRRKTIFLCILLELFIILEVSAHKPIFEGKNSTFDNPIIIPEYQISYAVYGKLEDKKDIDFVKFSANKGETFFVHIAVPKIKSNKDFRPYIALIGKGIYQRDNFPVRVPESYGIIIIPPGKYESFYEKYTGTSYYSGQSIIGEIPQNGDFYIAVFSEGTGGMYTLTTGQKESFGIMDIIKFPYFYLRVKYFFKPFEAIIITFGAILIAAALFISIRTFMKSGKFRLSRR